MNARPTHPAAPVHLVVGAGSGIGAAVAREGAAGGARIALAGRRADPLRRLAEECGGTAHPADATSPAEVRQLVEDVLAAHGRLDGLVACAGVMRAAPLRELTDEDWESSLATNLTSVFLLARAALPALEDTGGAMVTVGSVAGLRAAPGSAAYAASKAGAHMLTTVVAAEAGPRGVRANTVVPGWTRSEMADAEMAAFGAPSGLSTEDAYREATALVPQRRPAAPEEVARAVLWLLGPGASYVNGAALTVDGGTSTVDPGYVPLDYRLEPRTG
ncbi:SDR family oxidoreductase [Streptomyces sp. HNM0574]|uniref:SDR family NAD(P)-dependent oxidoreductase n=1 Tax=Streptomyces sp. HNM0574 TaxID=2714954 RepID=UPI00146C0EAF|nr:SDR family oxidoreductase [Streptomyces sp. HNM0574]NLU70505.1 SDR family oxidoreductase [Streptomyces sp. HNM0574]